MPAQRGSSKHCEDVEVHGSTLVRLVDAIEAVTSDGLVTPDESRYLRDAIQSHTATYQPLPTQASQLDNVFDVVGTIIHTGRISAWVERRAREAAHDEERLFPQAA